MGSDIYLEYINQCCKILNLIGIHPERMQLPLYFMVTSSNFLMIFLVMLVLFHKDEAIAFTDITEIFSNCTLMLHGIARLLTLYLKRSNLLDLMRRVQKYFWRMEDLTMEEKTHYIKMIEVAKFRFYSLGFFASAKTVMNSMMALFFNKDLVIINCYKIEWIPPYAMWFYQSIFTYVCIILPVIAMDSLLMIFVSLTQIQFEMLNREIDRVFLRSAREGKPISTLDIGKIIDHHNFLIDFTRRINDTFSNVLLAFLFLYVTSMCLEVYNSSEHSSLEAFMNALIYLVAATFGFVFLFCVPGQNLRNEADKTPNAVYFSEWNCDSKHSAAILMMIANGQKDVSIKAGKVIDINLATGVSTIKTLVSYCMFLRTVTVEEE